MTNQQTTIRYGDHELAGGTPGEKFFFLFVEVPLYGKNMIWQNWMGVPFPISNTDPSMGLTEADVASYRVQHETHHGVGDLELDFKTATGSEKLILRNGMGDEEFKASLAGKVDSTFGLVAFKDSVDYLFDNSISTEDLSLARDRTMSFEFQFEISSQNAAILGFVRNGIEFHLSPERGLSPNVIPEPGSFLVFGGIFGLAYCRQLCKRSMKRCSRGTKQVRARKAGFCQITQENSRPTHGSKLF